MDILVWKVSELFDIIDTRGHFTATDGQSKDCRLHLLAVYVCITNGATYHLL